MAEEVKIPGINLHHLKKTPAMLEYIKMILEKVSFDQHLFEKELRKGIRRLLPDELPELKNWCYRNFASKFGSILRRCFPEHQLAGSR